jgi:amidase
MPTSAQLPSVHQILELATIFGIEMSEADAGSYRSLMQGAMAACRRIDELQEFKLPVKYPRTPGYRPTPAENPYNAWYWKTEIKGATEGPLAGLTVALKDAICVAGVPMMNGSKVLEGFMPDVDATVVTRVLDAGGTIIGKCNSEDFSFSGASHTCALGPVRNPHKPTHSTGASSNGNAAALAAGEVDMCIGGDQGGSIRIPASWSGLVGLKPTYGLVPYTGAMMIEMTLDHLGPMARTVENVARLLSVISGPDGLDPRQSDVPDDFVRDYMSAIGKGCKGVKIGVVKEGFDHRNPWEDTGFPGGEEVVYRKVRTAIKRLKDAGATVTEVSVPQHVTTFHVWTTIALEGAANFMLMGNGVGSNWMGFYNTALADAVAHGMRSRPNDMSVTVKTVLLLGEYMRRNYNGRYYCKAQNLRAQMRKAYDDVLDSYDVLVMPTTPFRATEIPPPDCAIEETMFHALNMYHNTCQFDLTGHPAISVPCGVEDDLPIGLMLVGKRFDDILVLQVADAFEKIGDWTTM